MLPQRPKNRTIIAKRLKFSPGHFLVRQVAGLVRKKDLECQSQTVFALVEIIVKDFRVATVLI
jgi:hypothetical protein